MDCGDGQRGWGGAHESWVYENSTPKLDDEPLLTDEARRALEHLFGAIPIEDAPFEFSVWESIAEGEDAYVGEAGDLSTAAHAYTANWRRGRKPTTLTPAGLSIFGGIDDKDLYDHSLGVATRGASPCGDRIPPMFHQEAYSNAHDNPIETAAELWGDVLKGRLFLFTQRSDPFAGNLMESKLAYVTQRDVTNPDQVKTRYISDPRSEANERIDNDRNPPCVIPRHQNVARRILYWKRRNPSIPILICKRDV